MLTCSAGPRPNLDGSGGKNPRQQHWRMIMRSLLSAMLVLWVLAAVAGPASAGHPDPRDPAVELAGSSPFPRPDRQEGMEMSRCVSNPSFRAKLLTQGFVLLHRLVKRRSAASRKLTQACKGRPDIGQRWVQVSRPKRSV